MTIRSASLRRPRTMTSDLALAGVDTSPRLTSAALQRLVAEDAVTDNAEEAIAGGLSDGIVIAVGDELSVLAVGSDRYVPIRAGAAWTLGALSWTDITGADAGAQAAIASLAPTVGDRLVRNASGALARLPIGEVAMGGNDVDFAAGRSFTKTITTGVTLTFSNEEWGHQDIDLIFAVSGSPIMPTFPAGVVWLGGLWSSSATNHIQIRRRATGSYVGCILQDIA